MQHDEIKGPAELGEFLFENRDAVVITVVLPDKRIGSVEIRVAHLPYRDEPLPVAGPYFQ